MEETNVHVIKSDEREDFEDVTSKVGDMIEDAAETMKDVLVRPFFQSTIIRVGCVLVALKAVGIVGDILTNRALGKK